MLPVSSLLAVGPVEARIKRSQRAKDRQPCPATGERKGPCKVYVIDHVVPLFCGGSDTAANMLWQTLDEGNAKDKWERKGCGR